MPALIPPELMNSAAQLLIYFCTAVACLLSVFIFGRA